MLKAIQVGGHKKVRTVVEKASSLQEYIYHHRENSGRNINLKGVSGESSHGNEKHINNVEAK